MTRIELESIACQSCGAAQNPNRFNKACPDCGKDRFVIGVRRIVRGFDRGFELENVVNPLLCLMLAGDLGLVAYAVNEGPAALSPYHRWKSDDELEGMSGKDVAQFLTASQEERRELFVNWKRRQTLASLSGNQAICHRCELVFVAHSNPWNQKGYCSKKCLATDALASRPRR